MRTTLLCMALLAVGCRTGLPIFDCSADSQCGAGARCIDGRCALPAKDCPSGYKFYNSTQCVPVAGAPGDMSLDATADMAMSQSDQGCDCPDMAQDMTATTFVWRQQDSPVSSLLWGVGGSTAGDVYAVGVGGVILHTSDSGKTWVQQNSGVGVTLFSVWAASTNDVYVVGDGATVLHSTGDGKWTPFTNLGISSGTNLIAVYGSYSLDVYVAGASTMLHTNDQGKSWSVAKAGTTPGLPTCAYTGVWASGPGDIYVGGDNLCLFHGNGSTWGAPVQINNPATYLPRVWGTSPTNVYAVGSAVRRSNGNGSWAQETVPGPDSLYYGLWGSGPKDIYIAGSHGQIRHSTGDGTWQVQDSTVSNDLNSAWGPSRDDVYVVGANGTILHREPL